MYLNHLCIINSNQQILNGIVTIQVKMKKAILTVLVGLFGILNVAFAQDAKTVSLEQTKGEFTVKELKLSPGEYVFEVSNKGVDHPVGLVVAPEGKTDKDHHIQNAYLLSTPKDGESAKSKVVSLKKGTYVYFCPLNPTPQYKLIVQ